MQDVFDIYTIIFLALAVFIFLRLRSVLGQRTGRERPPYDPFSARDAVRGSTGDKVVTLPTRGVEPPAKPAEPAEPVDRWKDIAPAGSAVAAGLDAILAADKTFDPRHFLTGARAAYEMIVTAFAQGDRRTLRERLSKDVYDSFDTFIGERETRGETAETRFVSIDATTIVGAEVRARTRAGHGQVRVPARLGDARQDRQCHRRQSRQGHGRDRHLDLRARRHVARSQLEARGDRSGPLIAGGGRLSTPRLACVGRSFAIVLAILIASSFMCGPADAARRHGYAATWRGPAKWRPLAPRRPRRSGPVDPARRPGRADRLGRHRRLEQGRPRGRLRGLFGELPADRAHRPSGRREPSDVWRAACGVRPRVARRRAAHGARTSEAARKFFEENFRPVRIARLGDSAGFLTGYYEPIVDGSRFPTGIFHVPIYRRPPDLLPPAGATGSGFPNTGQSRRRNGAGELVPYHDRAEIEDGVLDGQHLEICWIKDPTDALFIQIQGSARVRLEDGLIAADQLRQP